MFCLCTILLLGRSTSNMLFVYLLKEILFLPHVVNFISIVQSVPFSPFNLLKHILLLSSLVDRNSIACHQPMGQSHNKMIASVLL